MLDRMHKETSDHKISVGLFTCATVKNFKLFRLLKIDLSEPLERLERILFSSITAARDKV